MKLLLMTVLMFSMASSVEARPVSYPSGWTIMQSNETDRHRLHVHYSPTSRDSLGYIGEYWQDQSLRFHGVQYNRLIKRWNQPQEQANFYFKSGLGHANQGQVLGSDDQWGGFIGLAADWETRRWFASYENRYYDLNDHGTYFNQKARVGIAPYIGDYGDLHTWIMLQVDHQSEASDKFSVTPLLRFFKGPFMLETGYSDQDEYLLNFILRL